MNDSGEWLRVKDAQGLFPLRRDLLLKLFVLLPHVTAGRAGRGEMRLVRRADLSRLLDAAAASGLDLWELAKENDPARVRAMLDAA